MARRPISLVRWMISIIILIPILIVWTFFLTGHWQTFKVISRSMEPTLLVNDYLIMRQQQDFPNLDNLIVVIRDQEGSSLAMVKRVVAAGNSSVRLSNGKIYLDGSKTPIEGDTLINDYNQEWKLAEDEIFVLGDNRNNSQDSTDFGPIPRTDSLGVITFRYWPFNRIGVPG